MDSYILQMLLGYCSSMTGYREILRLAASGYGKRPHCQERVLLTEHRHYCSGQSKGTETGMYSWTAKSALADAIIDRIIHCGFQTYI